MAVSIWDKTFHVELLGVYVNTGLLTDQYSSVGKSQGFEYQFDILSEVFLIVRNYIWSQSVPLKRAAWEEAVPFCRNPVFINPGQ